MIAATRSRPECRASLSTPKLPVRTTRKAFRETSKSAEPTLSAAARLFSRVATAGWGSITASRLPQLARRAALGSRRKGQRGGVDAVAQAGGIGAVREHVSQVRVAEGAPYLAA